MAKLFKTVQVVDTCFSEQDGGWSFALRLDSTLMSGWYDPEIKTLKLWYKDTEIVLRGESSKLLAKDLETAIREYNAIGLKQVMFKHE